MVLDSLVFVLFIISFKPSIMGINIITSHTLFYVTSSDLESLTWSVHFPTQAHFLIFLFQE